ncbi:MAG: hypothetical protein ACLUVV_02835 [Christensenellales bacterium]
MASTRINDVPIYIDDSGSATVPDIRARCMRFSARKRKPGAGHHRLFAAHERHPAVPGRQPYQEISELTRQPSCWPAT